MPAQNDMRGRATHARRFFLAPFMHKMTCAFDMRGRATHAHQYLAHLLCPTEPTGTPASVWRRLSPISNPNLPGLTTTSSRLSCAEASFAATLSTNLSGHV